MLIFLYTTDQQARNEYYKVFPSVSLSTRHEEVWRRGMALCILKLSVRVCVGKCLVLRPDCSTLPSGKAPSIHWLISWVDVRAYLDAIKR